MASARPQPPSAGRAGGGSTEQWSPPGPQPWAFVALPQLLAEGCLQGRMASPPPWGQEQFSRERVSRKPQHATLPSSWGTVTWVWTGPNSVYHRPDLALTSVASRTLSGSLC